MFAVIFEVLPKGERREDYLHHAGLLRPELESIDGFLTNDRYASLGRRGWVLSLSLWRNEKAVIRWRTQARHHAAQQMGRAEIFADYHLRVGEITSDTALPSGDVLPQTRFDETESGAARLAIVSESVLADSRDEPPLAEVATRLGLAQPRQLPGLVGFDALRHLVRQRDFLLLTSWADAVRGEAWLDKVGGDGTRHRQVRIIRDYAMRDRREAPQYHPPVADAAVS